METAQVRIRPFRFAFLVEPKDKKSLLRTFEVTSSLWGGVFNFIVPLFKNVPARYKQEYQKPVSAKAMINGFVEAFQPDYIVEAREGQSKEYGIDFPEKRTTSFTELLPVCPAPSSRSGYPVMQGQAVRSLVCCDVRQFARERRIG